MSQAVADRLGLPLENIGIATTARATRDEFSALGESDAEFAARRRCLQGLRPGRVLGRRAVPRGMDSSSRSADGESI